MLHSILVILSFLAANIFIFAYSILSKNSNINSSWKVLLLPLIFFPVIYFANVFFSEAWILSNKTPFSVAIIGITNLALGILVFLFGQLFYLKEPLNIQLIVGALIIILGVIVLNWR